MINELRKRAKLFNEGKTTQTPRNHHRLWDVHNQLILENRHINLLKELDKVKVGEMDSEEIFKRWLTRTATRLGRKETAVMARMIKLNLLIPRIAHTFWPRMNVTDIFNKYEEKEARGVLFENLQKDEKPDYNIHLLSGEYIAPKVFRNGGTLFMKCDTHDNLKDEFINLGKQVRLAVEALNKRKTQIKDEIQSIEHLQTVMTAHSSKYPNSSVESFGLQYSKLFARRSELERILNNI